MDLLIGVIGGAFFSWLFTFIYYKLSMSQQNKQYFSLKSNLSDEAMRLIVDSNRENMSVFDLNRLLESKIYNTDTDDPLPFKCCPKCGSDRLHRSGCDDYKGNPFYSIECKECGWSEGTE